MSLEEDIRQPKFLNEHQKAIVNLIFTTSWIGEQQKVIFDSENITPQQFNILRILRGSFPRPISTLQIRERMLDKMSDTSRIVDRLVTKGLANKKTCESDKRLVDISITEKGMAVLERLDNRNHEMDAIMSELQPDELKQLNHLLDKIRKSY
ncbi:MAG: MarR family transcriptional regulator [Chitinophagaceae bacterium]|nr:MarR family transcriptional regulator [Chitinophagaceae bacterium]